MIVVNRPTNKWGVLKLIFCKKGLELYNKYTWTIYKNRHNFYLRRQVYVKSKLLRVESFHRVLLKITDPKLFADHINRNSLDNRLKNLRIVTNQQNSFNRRKHADNKAKYKGISYKARLKKWQAVITVSGKTQYIGLYESQIDAAKAYNIKAAELFGEYANLNII